MLCLLLLAGGCRNRDEESNAKAVAAPATPVEASAVLQPTFTPTAAIVPTASSTATAAIAPTPTLSPTPAATLLPTEQLAKGRQLHRVGDYANARTALQQLLAIPNLDPTLQQAARDELVRVHMAEGAYNEALALLPPSPAVAAAGAVAAPIDDLAAKAEFLRGEALSATGAYTQAIAAYWRFLEAAPWATEVVQTRIASAYLAAGDREGAVAAYRRAADAATDTVARARLLETLATTYSGAGRYADAVKVYDEILAVAKNGGYRASIQHEAGKALAGAGDTPGAIARWRAATEEAPESGAAYLALVELVNRNVDFDLYQRGYIDLKAGALIPAINAYQAYLKAVGPTDSRVGQAWHGIGQAQLAAKDYNAAIATLDQVIANYRSCSCFGQAWLDKAAALLGNGDAIGARRTYRTFARDYPADPLAPEALWLSGLRALRDDNQAEAAADFLALADTFPDSPRTPVALYAVSLGAIKQGSYAQAITLLQRLQEKYPDHNWPAVAYWLGRAHQAHGQKSEARAAWQALVDKAPDIYYGILAAQSLRELPLVAGNFLNAMPTIAGPPTTLAGDDGSQAFAEQWLQSWLKAPVLPLRDLPAALAADQDLRMGRFLLAVDQRGEGVAALDRVYQRNKDNPRALYALSLTYEEMGAYSLSLLAMERLLQFSPAGLVENAPLFLQQRAYPRPFGALITQEALAHGLNPLLYFSLIRQESLFEEGARSYAAAQGLAQIIPDTGHWVAERLGHPDYTNEMIYRPYINLKFGAYYLNWTRGYLDDNLVSALVGYNAGPGNAEYWRKVTGADDTLFVEFLSINEPRIYVQTITTGLYHYTRLYGKATE
ncbi:MAG: outer membrane protein assembly factor BamD [Caldilinea sp. CFX5]|nr:outer membrane protein assembly factor BamD [Caldilinea sp. CFX5]